VNFGIRNVKTVDTPLVEIRGNPVGMVVQSPSICTRSESSIEAPPRPRSTDLPPSLVLAACGPVVWHGCS
jgi:hypothetical protein